MEHTIFLPKGKTLVRDVLFVNSGDKKFVQVEQDRDTGHYVVRTSDSVAVLVYVPERHEILFISQCRPAAVCFDNPHGYCVEMPAGRFDKDVSVQDLVVLEVQQEAGVTITKDDVQFFNQGMPVYLSEGVLTERIYLAYVEVELSQIEKTDRIYGCPDEGEKIVRKFVPVSDLLEMTFDNIVTMTLVNCFHLYSLGPDQS